MITETADKNQLLMGIDETRSGLQDLMSGLDENKINTVPFKDSWTPGQLFRHVSKSVTGMAQAIPAKAKPAKKRSRRKDTGVKKSISGLLH